MSILWVATDQGILKLDNQEGRWEVSGRWMEETSFTCLSSLNDTVLAGSRHGLFLSSGPELNLKEIQTLSDLHFRSLAFHPHIAGLVFAGTEPAAIFVSRDGGQSWQECPQVAAFREKFGWYLPYSPEAGCIRGFAFRGDTVYAAVEVGGLLESPDLGETWQLVGGSPGTTDMLVSSGNLHPDVHSVVVHPQVPSRLLAPTGGGFFSSNDNAANDEEKIWTRQKPDYCRAVLIDPTNMDRYLLGSARGPDRSGRIEESVDRGRSWELTGNGLQLPWQRHMVEKFYLQKIKGTEDLVVFGVLSNGELITSLLSTLDWKQVFTADIGVRDIAFG